MVNLMPGINGLLMAKYTVVSVCAKLKLNSPMDNFLKYLCILLLVFDSYSTNGNNDISIVFYSMCGSFFICVVSIYPLIIKFWQATLSSPPHYVLSPVYLLTTVVIWVSSIKGCYFNPFYVRQSKRWCPQSRYYCLEFLLMHRLIPHVLLFTYLRLQASIPVTDAHIFPTTEQSTEQCLFH